jgi:hypothetical protein
MTTLMRAPRRGRVRGSGRRDRGAHDEQGEDLAGEARTSSRLSRTDMSSNRRSGLRPHSGSGGSTRDQLYEEAKRKNGKGRSSMSKAELARAVGR